MIKALNLKPNDKIVVDGDIEVVAYIINQADGDVRIVFVGGRSIIVNFNRAFKKA